MSRVLPDASVDQPEDRVPSTSPDPERRRLDSLDALRGLAIVILLLVNTAGIRSSLPAQLNHPEWHGLTFADTFFPAFLFAMGAAMAFSSRAGRFRSVARRVVLLFVLGLALNSLRAGEVTIGPGILQKIAIAYLLAWLVMRLPDRFHLHATLGLLAATWAAFLWVPAPGVEPGSWEPGTNILAAIDRLVWGHPATEGLGTSILATANVLGGTIVVRGLRDIDPRRALGRILGWGVGAVALGLLLAPLVPINKQLWTPSFTILAHGITCLYLAGYWWMAEMKGWRAAVWPFVVLGRNPIFIFVGFTAAHVLLAPVRVPMMDSLAGPLPAFGASLVWSALLLGIAVGLSGWMDHRRIYVKV